MLVMWTTCSDAPVASESASNSCSESIAPGTTGPLLRM